MENHAEDVVHESLNVKAEAKNAMEIFLTENDIPFSIIKGNSEHIMYSLRAGMDYNDATLYYLKNFGNLQDPDTINTINLLVLEHEFLNVRNQYESYGNQRKDERLLGTFVFKDDDTGVNALKK